jgi:hypothetical protein
MISLKHPPNRASGDFTNSICGPSFANSSRMQNIKRFLGTILFISFVTSWADSSWSQDLCGKPGGLGGGDPFEMAVSQAEQLMMSPQADYLPSLSMAYRRLFTEYSKLMSKSIPLVAGSAAKASWHHDVELLLYRISTQITNVQGLDVASPKSSAEAWRAQALVYQPEQGSVAKTLLEKNGYTLMFSPRLEMEIALGLRGSTARADLLLLYNTVFVPLEIFLDSKGPQAKEFFSGLGQAAASGTNQVIEHLSPQAPQGRKKGEATKTPLLLGSGPENAFTKRTYAVDTNLESTNSAREPSRVTGHLKTSYEYFGLQSTATYNEMVDAYWRTSEQMEARISRMPKLASEKEIFAIRQTHQLHWQTLVMTSP